MPRSFCTGQLSIPHRHVPNTKAQASGPQHTTTPLPPWAFPKTDGKTAASAVDRESKHHSTQKRAWQVSRASRHFCNKFKLMCHQEQIIQQRKLLSLPCQNLAEMPTVWRYAAFEAGSSMSDCLRDHTSSISYSWTHGLHPTTLALPSEGDQHRETSCQDEKPSRSQRAIPRSPKLKLLGFRVGKAHEPKVAEYGLLHRSG